MVYLPHLSVLSPKYHDQIKLKKFLDDGNGPGYQSWL